MIPGMPRDRTPHEWRLFSADTTGTKIPNALLGAGRSLLSPPTLAENSRVIYRNGSEPSMHLTTNPRTMRWVIGLALLAAGPGLARGETWAERLGFAPGARVVIFSAHEMGVSWEMNDAGKELLTQDQVQSASVVATAPWFEDFASWCRENPGHDVGLNFALTNPYDRLQWRLLSPAEDSSTLTNGDGFPWKNAFQLACSASAVDVEKELQAQIAAARQAGIPLSHLSGYYGTVFARTDLAAVLLRTSQKHWIPTPVVELTPAHLERFRQEGFPLADDLVELVRNYPLPKVDDIRFLPPTTDAEQKQAELCRLLRELQPGLTTIIFHPAVASLGSGETIDRRAATHLGV